MLVLFYSILSLLWFLCLKFVDIYIYVSIDDKAIIPVGEPGCSWWSTQLLAPDHDFHIHGIVPSVAFFVDIPEHSSNSFFSGQAIVTNKDKVTQPSSAIWHSIELTGIIHTHFGDSHGHASKPVLVVVSDGGPDHHATFGSVKIADICLF